MLKVKEMWLCFENRSPFFTALWNRSGDSLKNYLQSHAKPEQPKAPLANNVRPVQDLNGRSVRTNIKFERRKVKAGGDMCPEVVKDLTFKANSVWTASVPKMENPYMRGSGGGAY